MASNWNWRLPSAGKLAEIQPTGSSTKIGKQRAIALRAKLEAYVAQAPKKPSGVSLLNVAGDFLGLETLDLYPDFGYLYYLNTGETYATTLLYNQRTGNLYVGNWGDFVERNS